MIEHYSNLFDYVIIGDVALNNTMLMSHDIIIVSYISLFFSELEEGAKNINVGVRNQIETKGNNKYQNHKKYIRKYI